ncbi:DM13 domain-containing protein [Paenibacillus sedimenti]|uniref:DM13 domain-containing protein n=1 Tax=Paenibacillus sedimenti TaxID=2770274 RepID=A0A926QLF2_9BACL|nr:DM13 domain-containing protein [Paenibacillus sedimenti]MBD0383545.1 DM13 domain-containing protein [Paenibacillus sedimenti]
MTQKQKRSTFKTVLFSLVGIAVLGTVWYLGSPLLLNRTVEEALPGSTQSEMQKTDMPKTEMSTPEKKAEAKPTTLYTGTFVDGDNFHKVKGIAKTVETDGQLFLRLEDLDSTNGPDLYLYLTKEGMKTSEGINLGALKGNKGNQNYELPKDADLDQYNQVVIYCKQFSVDFGKAALKAI